MIANSMVAGLKVVMSANELKQIEMKPLQVFVDESSIYFDRQTQQVYVGGQLIESEMKQPIILGCTN